MALQTTETQYNLYTVQKGDTLYKIAKNNIYVLFPIEFITTKRFHYIAKNVGGKIYIPNGRINFESGLGKQGKSPAFGSVIIKLTDENSVEYIDLKAEKSKITDIETVTGLNSTTVGKKSWFR